MLTGSILSSVAQMVDPVTWTYSLKRVNDSIYELRYTAAIEPTWHMYSQSVPPDGPNATTFTFEKSTDYQRIDTVLEVTKAEEEFDQMFNMKVPYFALEAEFSQKIKVIGKQPFKVTGTIDYQICDDHSCSLGSNDFSFNIEPSGKPAGESAIVKPAPDDSSTKSSASTSNLWRLFWIAFGSGLIALLTPCVFPMIPMTVSFFMHGEKSRHKSLFEAVFFGISIVAIFTVIGTIVAVAFGPGIANFMSTHWIPNVLFFLIFLFFAAWFFGMFEINLPNWMISKSDQRADKGGIGGPFFMAFTTVLVSFSCTGPIVGTVLVQSAGGEILKPIIGMLGFGMAFALPFTLFAIFPSWLTSLPKSGGWLNSVKVILGFIELALGLKFLSIADQTYHWGILDREVYLAFWIVIFTLMGFYLLGKIKFKHDSEVPHVGVPRLMLAIITFTFVVYMIPGMIGAPLKGLAGYLPPETTNDFDLRQVIRDNAGTAVNTAKPGQVLCEKPEYSDRLKLPHGLVGYFDFDQALACAKAQNKPVFIDFTGHGCVNCREMEARVWSDPRVLSRLRDQYIVVALYVDDKVIKLPESEWVTSTYDGKVKKTLGKKYQDFQITRFGQNTQPQYALLDTEGKLMVPTRSYDLNIDGFIEFLDEGIDEFNKNKTSNN
ncbi:MAG: cytochrome c biogenesis protein CcdA [Bacteroidales bacterium]|jgi:thiol:disulfide interchange protein DsbD